ncbi:UNVERIFIED_CONTAM: hypothetical protein Slati_2899200 [Sesamum latifolium]|uniref:Retrotransposon gag domain-containing protein n=1 Tax=Sesamum latifolium TaxID=2727402 RepID=A0AAW2VE46_9LAMI
MEITRAVERPMIEYSFPIADGTIFSIAKPTIQANNFEIKPPIIQIIRSSVQFSGLPDEDPNKYLAIFLEICDTFKFNGASDDVVRLRIFPFSLCDIAKDWLQSLPAGSITTWAALTQKFLAKYFPHAKTVKMLNVITSFVQLDRESLYDEWEHFKTAGGTIMKKLPSEAFNIIDEITTNLYSYGQERTIPFTGDIHSIDAMIAFSAKMAALTHKVDNLGAIIWNGALGPWCVHEMPSYAKFLKEVISNKRKWEGGETVKLNEECSAILQNKLPPKLKDPGSFSHYRKY